MLILTQDKSVVCLRLEIADNFLENGWVGVQQVELLLTELVLWVVIDVEELFSGWPRP